MKIDELIKSRKEGLDLEHPPLEVWHNISKDLTQPKTINFRWWKVAAILFVGLSIGLLVRNRLLQAQINQLASLGDLSENYRRVEENYMLQVAELEESVLIDDLRGNSEFEWVFEELKILEEINTIYRSDIGKAKEQQLVGVLIDYYEKRIKLLKRLELEIERNSNRKKDEKVNTGHIRI